jgi:hypothetical protein
MTMPHLMNCPHSDDSWCLTCVRTEWLYTMEIRMTLRAFTQKIPILENHDLKPLVDYAKAILDMDATEYSEKMKELDVKSS